jgi:hypothetical protein
MEQSVIDTAATDLIFRNPEIHYERRSLSIMSTIEDLLERKGSSSGLESRNYGRRYPPR